jgi:hypothetical protein
MFNFNCTFSIRRGPLACAWIETGNPRQPLVCVWTDEEMRAFSHEDHAYPDAEAPAFAY